MTENPTTTSVSAMPPMLLTTRHAARLMALCEKTVRNLVKAGDLRAVRCGRALRIDPRDITSWIDRQKGTPR